MAIELGNHVIVTVGPPTLGGMTRTTFGRPGTVVIPVPGLRGQDGEDGDELTPEDMEELINDVTDAIEDDLEPPVNLVLLFENGMA